MVAVSAGAGLQSCLTLVLLLLLSLTCQLFAVNDGQSAAVLMGTAKSIRRLDFDKIGRSPADHEHEVVIVVKQNNVEEVKDLLYAVSTMGSPGYGQHLTFEEVGQLVQNPSATEAVQAWLSENGARVTHSTKFGEYITAKAPIHLWERMLFTTFLEHRRTTITSSDVGEKILRDGEKRTSAAPSATAAADDNIIHRADVFHLPAHLVEHVEAVLYVIDLPPRTFSRPQLTPLRSKQERKKDSDIKTTATVEELESYTFHSFDIQPDTTKFTAGYSTPLTLKSMYNISTNHLPLGSQAIYASAAQYFEPSDLAYFQADFGYSNDPVITYVGHSPTTSCADVDNCDEATVDVQYITTTSPSVPTTFWYDSSGDSTFYTFLLSVYDSISPPKVISISYGAYETDVASYYISLFDSVAMKLALRGVTIIVASGDDGVTGFNFDDTSVSLSTCGYYASWPASSPYVTSVGGTMVASSVEIACSAATSGGITSGGGFSNSVPAPSFQFASIASYASKYTATQSSNQAYNTSNRGYPDVSMLANKLVVYIDGTYYGVSGTSISAPVFAGLVSSVNAVRIQYNYSTLGWLNPSIYSNNGEFTNDITSGNNDCTRDASRCCSIGFQATSGWDPVTGFGSVNYAKFLSYYTSDISTFIPTPSPTPAPTSKPTAAPTASPTAHPTANPTAAPTFSPTISHQPTAAPTARPSAVPSASPTAKPTAQPTSKPTADPTAMPSANPSAAPTLNPTAELTDVPTARPTAKPTAKPSTIPTLAPTASPTVEPSADPTVEPSAAPSADSTVPPTAFPTPIPSAAPTASPSAFPTAAPSAGPTSRPTAQPTPLPTVTPTAHPTTASPTAIPSPAPTATPTMHPTPVPSSVPTTAPTAYPTTLPTLRPSAAPTSATSSFADIVYGSSQTLSSSSSSLSAASFLADAAAVSAFEDAVVKVLSSDGINSATVIDAQDSSSRRALLSGSASSPATAVTMSLATTSSALMIVVSYSMSFHTVDESNAETIASSLYSSIVSTLSSSVSSGQFSSLLIASNTELLKTVNATTVPVVSAAVVSYVSPPSSSSSSSSGSITLIIAVAAGGGTVVLLIVAVLYCRWRSQSVDQYRDPQRYHSPVTSPSASTYELTRVDKNGRTFGVSSHAFL